MLGTSQIDQRDTHRLIPAHYADGGASVLTRLSEDEGVLNGIFELDNATNDRLRIQQGLSPLMGPRGLVFGIPSYRIINAAFCHAAPTGGRFNSSERGAWYAAFELKTSQAEVAYHKQKWLQETSWNETEIAEYVDYLADFRAEFHDLRGSSEFGDCLSHTSYAASQILAAQLLALGSAGIIYPSVRRAAGTCIACFRPVLVMNVRQGHSYRFEFPDCYTAPEIRRM